MARQSHTEQQTRPLDRWPTRRIVAVTLTVGIVLYLVYNVPGAVAYVFGRIFDVVVIVILSVALAVLLAPPVDLLCRVRLPLPERTKRMVATVVVLALLVWVIWALGSLTAAQLLHEFQRLVAITKDWLVTAPITVQRWLDAYQGQVPPELISRATDAVAQWTQGMLQYQFGFAKGALLRGWYVVELLVIPVLAFYFLTDAGVLRAGALAMTPARYRAFVAAVLADAGVLLHSYVQAQVLLCIIKAVLVGALLYFAGVNMYLTLGFISGLFRMAPVVGPLVAGVPCVGVALVQKGTTTGLIVLVGYALLIGVDGKLITPLLLAEGAKLHPVFAILSLLLGYEFLGILGLLIAVPAAGIIRAVYLRYQEMLAEATPEGAAVSAPPEDST